MYDFIVTGSHGTEWFKAISQELAMCFYKVTHGEDSCIHRVEWVH
jgi:hypothetical protein